MANSLVTTDLYATIASNYATLYDTLALVEGYASAALDAIVDITSGDYTPDPTGEPDAALKAELALLPVFNTAYVSSQSVAGMSRDYLSAVRALNNLVIAGSDLGTDATKIEKLDAFIVEVRTAEGNLSQSWIDLCSDAGFTVDTWDDVL